MRCLKCSDFVTYQGLKFCDPCAASLRLDTRGRLAQKGRERWAPAPLTFFACGEDGCEVVEGSMRPGEAMALFKELFEQEGRGEAGEEA